MFIVCGDRHWQYVSADPVTGTKEYSCGFKEENRSLMQWGHRGFLIEGADCKIANMRMRSAGRVNRLFRSLKKARMGLVFIIEIAYPKECWCYYSSQDNPNGHFLVNMLP